MADQNQNMAMQLLQQQETINDLTAQLQQLANLIQAQQQQVPPAQESHPVTFAVTPSQHDVNQIIDYATKASTALYKAGSKTLTTKFDMKPESTLVQYGQIAVETLENAFTSWQQGGAKENSCSTQNNEQMQKCIMNTLTKQACL
mmetsp:Transcript_27409/g.55999  ORF Transcript_27409/g.55999 Transcript_27409/m.55999 type:complete len:145 (+) Transcript_27409:295-729(+)